MQKQLKLALAAILASSTFTVSAEEAHHPADAPAGPAAPAAAAQPPLDQAMVGQMQKMQEAHDKAAAAKTPAERQAALQEGMATMRESLAMMGKQQGGAGCMGMGMHGMQDGAGMGMMDMMMKMMKQQESMMAMPMEQQ